MPMCFRALYQKVAVIIDCFELFTEKPSGALNQVQTYSNYKHHQTVKYLIGISPQGTVTFISDGWGGRTSDKHIVEKSGFLLQNVEKYQNYQKKATAVAVEAALAEQKRTFETLLDVQLKAFQACVTTMMDSTNTRIDSFLWIRHISNVVRFCMLAFNCLIYCFFIHVCSMNYLFVQTCNRQTWMI